MQIYTEKDLEDAIIEFKGDYSFLSNFYNSVTFYNGNFYRNTESAYQRAKYCEANAYFTNQFAFTTGAEAKRIDRQFYKEGVVIDDDWETKRLSVMLQLNLQKFHPSGKLWALLDATNDKLLVEGNYWGDRFWGMTPNEEGDLEGRNKLGKTLMQVRKYYREKLNATSNSERI